MRRLLAIALLLILPGPSWAQAATGTMVGDGNVLRFDFPTANIPFAVDGWGETCGVIAIGHTAGAALWYQRFPTPSTRGHIATVDLIVVTAGLAPGTAITYAIAKADGDIQTALRNWRGYLHKTLAGELKLVFVLGEDANPVHWVYPVAGSLQPGVVIRAVHTYDIAHQRIAWSVNGALVNEIAMTASHPQNSATQITGSSGSSDGRDTLFLVGNISWTEVEP